MKDILHQYELPRHIQCDQEVPRYAECPGSQRLLRSKTEGRRSGCDYRRRRGHSTDGLSGWLRRRRLTCARLRSPAARGLLLALDSREC